MLRIKHPDGTAETFTYNTLGQVLSHTNGKGQTTRLQRTSRGLPSSRQDAKGEWIRYSYDKALRLTVLVNIVDQDLFRLIIVLPATSTW
ncbi:hypothetical protein REH59_15750 [Pseudomonas sp. BO3-4]|uniref:YD repeat-containing protein n=1 Tax=Pseudomonas putida (strain DOT-T1E) TaxID=1196325 RepID=I7CAZ8_PSEPT|nr:MULTISPECIES: YD repeat-containing protein [Pseudomonas]AFO50401.1 YD repeat-containing protein [Pseudomonas putida DOT-T1E]UZM96272.1 hypothetical protein OPZ46_12895 [Pseudomonas putida DOT-T1E]WPO27680.1 hypothetical protein REH59_15750 [Pseudomonas sp. BO3-4]